MYYVTDTHSLIWFLSDDKRLGTHALNIFNNADKGKEIIIVPTIVLAEAIYLCEKKNLKLNINEVITKIKGSINYIPYNLNTEVVEKVAEIKNISDMHDRIIIATSLILKAALITKDREVTKSEIIKTVW